MVDVENNAGSDDMLSNDDMIFMIKARHIWLQFTLSSNQTYIFNIFVLFYPTSCKYVTRLDSLIKDSFK